VFSARFAIGVRYAKLALWPDRALLGNICIVTSLTDTVEAVCHLMADNRADPPVIQQPVM
jgi:hypothetical protein